ncbi:MAG: dihydrodipicolinate synthase family protein [Ignavibacteria bacterium]
MSESTDKNIIMHNVPARTSVNMNADTCLRLAELEKYYSNKRGFKQL